MKSPVISLARLAPRLTLQGSMSVCPALPCPALPTHPGPERMERAGTSKCPIALLPGSRHVRLLKLNLEDRKFRVAGH